MLLLLEQNSETDEKQKLK